MSSELSFYDQDFVPADTAQNAGPLVVRRKRELHNSGFRPYLFPPDGRTKRDSVVLH